MSVLNHQLELGSITVGVQKAAINRMVQYAATGSVTCLSVLRLQAIYASTNAKTADDHRKILPICSEERFLDTELA